MRAVVSPRVRSPAVDHGTMPLPSAAVFCLKRVWGFERLPISPVIDSGTGNASDLDGFNISAMIKNEFDDTVVFRTTRLPGKGRRQGLPANPVRFYRFRHERVMLALDCSGGPLFSEGDFARLRSFEPPVTGVTECATAGTLGALDSRGRDCFWLLQYSS